MYKASPLKVRPGNYVTPRHSMPFDSRYEGSECVLMTWRAVSARPWVKQECDALLRQVEKAQSATSAPTEASRQLAATSSTATPGWWAFWVGPRLSLSAHSVTYHHPISHIHVPYPCTISHISITHIPYQIPY